MNQDRKSPFAELGRVPSHWLTNRFDPFASALTDQSAAAAERTNKLMVYAAHHGVAASSIYLDTDGNVRQTAELGIHKEDT